MNSFRKYSLNFLVYSRTLRGLDPILVVCLCIGTKSEWINYSIVLFIGYVYTLCFILLYFIPLNIKHAPSEIGVF